MDKTTVCVQPHDLLSPQYSEYRGRGDMLFLYSPDIRSDEVDGFLDTLLICHFFSVVNTVVEAYAFSVIHICRYREGRCLFSNPSSSSGLQLSTFLMRRRSGFVTPPSWGFKGCISVCHMWMGSIEEEFGQYPPLASHSLSCRPSSFGSGGRKATYG